jgi:hypothetical protein
VPTLVYNTGFEHGVLAPAVQAGIAGDQRAWLAVGAGTPALDGTGARSGSYGWRRTDANAYNIFNHPTASTVVGRIYFNVSALPAAGSFASVWGHATSSSSATRFGFYYDRDAGTIRAHATEASATHLSSGIGASAAVTPGTWHRLDYRIVSTGATWNIDWQLDGGSTISTSFVGTAAVSWNSGLVGGHINGNLNTTALYIDDVAISATSADFPLGAGYGGSMRPSSLTLHTNGTFVQNATATAITTGDWALVDDVPPLTSTADYIRQTAQNTTTAGHPYVGFNHSNTDTINGVAAYFGANSTANQGNTARIWAVANGVDTYLYGRAAANASVGATALRVSGAQLANGGVAWTDAMLDALIIRFGTGSGTDVTPNPQFQFFFVEIDYTPGLPKSDIIRSRTHRLLPILVR